MNARKSRVRPSIAWKAAGVAAALILSGCGAADGDGRKLTKRAPSVAESGTAPGATATSSQGLGNGTSATEAATGVEVAPESSAASEPSTAGDAGADDVLVDVTARMRNAQEISRALYDTFGPVALNGDPVIRHASILGLTSSVRLGFLAPDLNGMARELATIRIGSDVATNCAAALAGNDASCDCRTAATAREMFERAFPWLDLDQPAVAAVLADFARHCAASPHEAINILIASHLFNAKI